MCKREFKMKMDIIDVMRLVYYPLGIVTSGMLIVFLILALQDGVDI